MKRLLTQLGQLSLGVTLFLFGGQNVYAASQSNQLDKMVDRAISHYYAQSFNVTATDDGVVRIQGDVPVLYERFRIYDIVAKVQGIREIKNEIVVNTPMIPDKIIKANILEKIALNHAILEPERIEVEVNRGIVFYKGSVNFFREKLIANTIASWEKGVKGIENEIFVVGKPEIEKSDQELSVEMQDIIQKQFPNEKNVAVTIQDGVATLAGSTRTLWTEDQLVKEISDVIGVRKVISTLKFDN